MGSTNKSIADGEAAKSHPVAQRSRPEHSAKGKAARGPAAREVTKEAKK